MRTALATVTAAAALALAGCGGAQTPEAEVKQTAREIVEALEKGEPPCKLYADVGSCAAAVMELKALDANAADLFGIPDDWRGSLDKAAVVIEGDTAFIEGFRPGHYVRRGGKWLSDNRDNRGES